MRRPLPTDAEAADILARKRTRPPRRPPATAAKSLAKPLAALEARYASSGPGPGVLAQRWREIVGDVLARRTEPVRLARSRRGAAATLEIRVGGSASALIQHQAPDILARVNMALGSDTVDRLRIVQGPVRAKPAPETPARPSRRRGGPLDAALEAELAQGLAKAPEGDLKSALLRLGREVLRRG